MNRHSGTLAVWLLLGLTPISSSLSAQSPDQQSPAPLSAQITETPPALEGTLWRLAAYRSGDALAEITESARPMLFRFEEGRLSGSAGCNRLLGTYTLSGDSISFDPRMAATMMACPEPIMAQEEAVGAALKQIAGYRIDGNLLELRDGDGRPLLRLLWEKASPLMGVIWQLRRYNNGKQAMTTVLTGTEVTIELRDDGTIGGSDGCNRYMSGYTLEGEGLAIGPLATTRMACKGPEGADRQAADYAAALGLVQGYRIDGDTLSLVDADGKPLAELRPLSSLPLPPGETGPAAPVKP